MVSKIQSKKDMIQRFILIHFYSIFLLPAASENRTEHSRTYTYTLLTDLTTSTVVNGTSVAKSLRGFQSMSSPLHAANCGVRLEPGSVYLVGGQFHRKNGEPFLFSCHAFAEKWAYDGERSQERLAVYMRKCDELDKMIKEKRKVTKCTTTTTTPEPTYTAGTSTKTTPEPTFTAGSSTKTTPEPTFTAGSSVKTTPEPTFTAGYSTKTKPEPTYTAGTSTKTTPEPTYTAGSSAKTTTTITPEPTVTAGSSALIKAIHKRLH